jgi:CheY-like chemotaxis protein
MTKDFDPNNIIILVVEDDEVNYILIKEILKGLELKPVRATTKDEVLQLMYSKQDFSLILMDVFLNGSENGYTIANELADLNIDLPIFIVTAYTSEVIKPEYKNMKNIREVIHKPIDIDKFKLSLLGILEG